MLEYVFRFFKLSEKRTCIEVETNKPCNSGNNNRGVDTNNGGFLDSCGGGGREREVKTQSQGEKQGDGHL